MKQYKDRIESTVQAGVIEMFAFVESATESSESSVDRSSQSFRIKGITKRGMVQQKSKRR